MVNPWRCRVFDSLHTTGHVFDTGHRATSTRCSDAARTPCVRRAGCRGIIRLVPGSEARLGWSRAASAALSYADEVGQGVRVDDTATSMWSRWSVCLSPAVWLWGAGQLSFPPAVIIVVNDNGRNYARNQGIADGHAAAAAGLSRRRRAATWCAQCRLAKGLAVCSLQRQGRHQGLAVATFTVHRPRVGTWPGRQPRDERAVEVAARAALRTPVIAHVVTRRARAAAGRGRPRPGRCIPRSRSGHRTATKVAG